MIRTVPAHLKVIRPPRTPCEAYELVHEHGGLCQFGLRLDVPSADDLNSLRARIRRLAGSRYSRQATRVSQIDLYHELPASGYEFYREVLEQHAERITSFDLQLGHPFLTGAKGAKFKGHSDVSMYVEKSPEIDTVCGALWQAFHEVPDISNPVDSATEVSNGIYRPKVIVASSTSMSHVDPLVAFGLVQEELHQRAPLNLTAVGFCMRLQPPRLSKKMGGHHPKGTIFADWEDILFRG